MDCQDCGHSGLEADKRCPRCSSIRHMNIPAAPAAELQVTITPVGDVAATLPAPPAVEEKSVE